MKRSLEEYLALDWRPVIETVTDQDGTSYRLTIPLLADFAVYGTMEEIGTRFREALESHLAGYLAVGKVIPEPPSFGPTVTEPDDDTASNAQRGTRIVRDNDLIAV